jgi:ParB family chromosome partitioning protein
MQFTDIPVSEVDVSQSNVRKNLEDGEIDSSLSDLANAIESQGLLQPITVYRAKNRFALVVGQRRLLAVKQLGWKTIPAIVRDAMSDEDAIAMSLVENVHRADMNPKDKAVALKALLDRLGTVQKVQKETGMSGGTIRRYVVLLDLAPELQEKLAAGEASATTGLSQLAKKIKDPQKQIGVYEQIGGFTQDVQTSILGRIDDDLENLEELVDRAHEGVFDRITIRECPRDCPNIPKELEPQVEAMLKAHAAAKSN